jgi:hypothetical protein
VQHIVVSSDASLCSMNHNVVTNDGQCYIINHGVVGDRPKASLLSCHSHWLHSSAIAACTFILLMSLLKHEFDGRCRERAVCKEA